ncbi:ribokinase [Allosaccharopolyspora coralli]|uniref:Ribokinase n=1 Tax=Allosaccharopolyspora coralli TaxID=2665642 RepID=A0A5Q3QH98_9PSEU|nr:ribokinase [Allosaccharopolyspora coralli]QGK70197.1 ribokinase [Allosaccharopolyspora coralli]
MVSTVDLVVVGSLNVDLTARVARHPMPGETVRAAELTTCAGGKGANQAVAAARLGARTAMIGRVGTDAHADTLLEALRTDGVDTTHTVHDSDTPTGTALITVANTGENSIVVSAAANARLSPEDIADAHSLIGSARVVSLVLEIPVDTVVAASRAARSAAARVVLNLSPVLDLPEDVLALADPLIVNEHEAREILHRSGTPPTGPSGTGDAVALRGLGARSAVVTLGGDGAAVAEGDHTEHIPGVVVEAVDTTGAGDAFAATVAWRLSQGDALPDAARWATRVSAHSVQHPGAQPSYPMLHALPEPAGSRTLPGNARKERVLR